MRKMLLSGLALLLLGCSPEKPVESIDKPLAMQTEWGSFLERRRETWRRYGNNIIYSSKIDFNSVSREKIKIPKDLEQSLRTPKIKDQGKFESIIFKEAEIFGYTKEQIKALAPKRALELSMGIVISLLDYAYVDDDMGFIKRYGKNLPIERYLEIGKGDCDKYTDALVGAFNSIKKINPNLKNIYVSDFELGGQTITHDWNSVLCLTKNKIWVTHIDLTAYDGGGRLEGIKGFHVPKDNLEFLAIFYEHLCDFKTSQKLYLKLLKHKKDKEEKERIRSTINYIDEQLRN